MFGGRPRELADGDGVWVPDLLLGSFFQGRGHLIQRSPPVDQTQSGYREGPSLSPQLLLLLECAGFLPQAAQAPSLLQTE